jgi:zinc transport system permease protein
MAFAIFLLTWSNQLSSNIMSYLFGSILTINNSDIYIVLGLLFFLILFISFNYRKLTYMTFNRDMALVKGININFLNVLFLILVAITVVSLIKVVGILLVSSFLIIPALIGLNLAKSFKQSFLISFLVGSISSITGIILSYYLDSSASALIVLTMVFIFIFTLFFKK